VAPEAMVILSASQVGPVVIVGYTLPPDTVLIIASTVGPGNPADQFDDSVQSLVVPTQVVEEVPYTEVRLINKTTASKKVLQSRLLFKMCKLLVSIIISFLVDFLRFFWNFYIYI
jgi:hypothetical protein